MKIIHPFYFINSELPVLETDRYPQEVKPSDDPLLSLLSAALIFITYLIRFILLPDDKILDNSKFKAFADDRLFLV